MRNGNVLGVLETLTVLIFASFAALSVPSVAAAPSLPHVGFVQGLPPVTEAGVYATEETLLPHYPAKVRVALPPADSPLWTTSATYLAGHPAALKALETDLLGDGPRPAAVRPDFSNPFALPDGDALLLLDGIASVATVVTGALTISTLLASATCIAATAGWCALVIAAILGALIIYQLVTFSASDLFSKPSMIPVSKSLWNSFASGIRTAEAGLGNTLRAMNLSYVELQYQAAAAALSQLGNASFNIPLDLVTSNIPQQLASLATAEEITEGAWATSTFYWEQSFAAQTNGFQGGGSACSFYLTGASTSYLNLSPNPSGGEFPPLTGDGSVAAGSDPACFTISTGGTPAHWSYAFQPLTEVALPAEVYVGGSSQIAYKLNSVTSATFEFAPVAGPPDFNITLSTQVARNITLPSGGYTISTSSGVGILGISVTTPLTVGASTAEQMGIWAQETRYPNSGGPTLVGFLPPTVSAGCGSSSCPSFQLFGLGGGATDLFPSIWNLESQAGAIGQLYWSFLRGLGYRTPASVPANCIIPNPADAFLAYGIPVAQMATMNFTSLEAVYYSYLSTLGYTFGASSALSAVTFCGKHVVIQQAGQFPWLNSYVNATGDIYIPNGTSSVGGIQHFGVPSSWNVTRAQILILPVLANYTPVLNETWLGSEKNPLNVIYITNAGTNLSLVNYLNFAVGNSSQTGGSAYPTAIDPKGGVGVAFYLTGCSLYGKNTSACAFYHGTFFSNGTWTNCGNMTTQATPECSTSGGGSPAVTTSCGGNVPFFGTIVNSLFGFFGNLLGLGCPLALLVGGIITVVIVVVLLVVVVYAVRAGYSAARGRNE